jgi:hypothetical protein
MDCQDRVQLRGQPDAGAERLHAHPVGDTLAHAELQPEEVLGIPAEEVRERLFVGVCRVDVLDVLVGRHPPGGDVDERLHRELRLQDGAVQESFEACAARAAARRRRW